ncbi:MAG: chloride channel protein [Lachnospiraceae bacterium]|nr:chloride channel protein [Lachnospiraceae bacterium]
MDRQHVSQKLRHDLVRLSLILKWVVFSFLTGLLLGVLGAFFYHAIAYATAFRQGHPYVLALLPVGAVIILFLYHIFNDEDDRGTNLVLSAIHRDDNIPLRMAPLIFVSTVFSHFVGASVGREGAALQFGGSIGNNLGKLFRFNDTDKKTMIMVGMSGVFSALFGTPVAAAVFSMEVVSVGIMHYNALMPCVVSSFVAREVARRLGAPAPFFDIGAVPGFDLTGALKITGLAVLCGLISIVFCAALHRGNIIMEVFLKNRYIRALVLGSMILVLTLIVGDQTYNGAGVDYINACMAGDERPFGSVIKIVFTVFSIIAGYKGGEIVPSFFIGASLGSTYGGLIHFSPALCAAVGMGSVFCGVTNCPITSLIICLELFGFDGLPYFALAVAFSYLLSGYYGLYTAQTIVFSKYRSKQINKETH